MTEDMIRKVMNRYRENYGKCNIVESRCSCCPPSFLMSMDGMLDIIEESLLHELDD